MPLFIPDNFTRSPFSGPSQRRQGPILACIIKQVRAQIPRGYFLRAMYVRVRREIHARQDKITADLFFSLFFFHHPDPSNANPTCLPLVRRLRRRRQLKIVSRRRAVTKRTENDGQPDWQRLCTRHYPLQVLRAAAYICMSARIPQPRDAWRLVRKRKKEREKEEKEIEGRKIVSEE